MSGVHRRDVRNLGRLAEPAAEEEAGETPLNMASQVAARWLSQTDCLDDEGQPRPLPRSGEPRTSTAWWPASAAMCGPARCLTSWCAWAWPRKVRME